MELEVKELKLSSNSTNSKFAGKNFIASKSLQWNMKISLEGFFVKDYQSADIRNVAVVGHGKTGKTSLLEACLYNAGANKRLGKVDDGTSTLDFEAEESKRKMSINATLAITEWNNTKINFIDTPGYPDLVGEVLGGLAAADIALLIIAAPNGIEVETEKIWATAEELKKPRAFFINKLDREHADFNKVINDLRAKYGPNVVPMQIPVGSEASFKDVIDLLTSTDDSVEEAKGWLIEAAAEFNDELMEKYFEGEELDPKAVQDALNLGIASAQIFPVFCGSAAQNIAIKNLLDGIVAHFPSPIRTKKSGTNPKTDEPVWRKSADPFSAQIFKTMVDPFVGRLSYMRIFSGDMKADSTYMLANSNGSERVGSLFTMQGKKQITETIAHAGDIVVVAKLAAAKTGDTLCDPKSPIVYEKISYPEPMLTMSVSSAKKGEEDKVFSSIVKQQDEDPTITLRKDPETKETIIAGIGEVHLDILSEKIQRKFGVQMKLGEPRIAFRETIRKALKVEGKHKKQSGGHGQYGHVWIEISPKNPGEGNEFVETIFGGSVPRQYIPAVEKGTQETLAQGVIAGYPVVDMKVNLFDGSYHPVDSSEAAFKMATSIALKKGILQASPILLEPIEEITVHAPESYMGDIMGRLNSKRAKILGMGSIGKNVSEIKALIPMSELYKYATDLRSLTQGRGSYSLKFAHYEPMPEKLAEKIIEEHKKASEDKD